MLHSFRWCTPVQRLCIVRSLSDCGSGSKGMPLSKAVEALEAIFLKGTIRSEIRKTNASSLSSLRRFLAHISQSSPPYYPPATMERITLTDERGKTFTSVLKTTGGDCSSLIESRLEDLLTKAGLEPTVFYFDRQNLASNMEKVDAAKIATAREKAQKMFGIPSQTMTETEFLSNYANQNPGDDWLARLRVYDPVFDALAAVPWLNRDKDKEKRDYLRSKCLDDLEALGFLIRGACHLIWDQKEHRYDILSEGKNDDTQAAIKAILFHTKRYEKLFGPSRHDTVV